MSYSPSYNPRQSSTNLLSTNGEITADEIISAEEGRSNNINSGNNNNNNNNGNNNLSSNSGNASGDQSIWQQSAHPIALFFLYIFRLLAIMTYLLCGFFSSSYVFSTVLVVVLLALDFWTVRNVSGRTLVGLRFWNQIDEDGSSYWVFEHRSPDQPSNAVDAKMFWIAMYAFPAAWILLLFIGLLKFNLSFLPIVLLALVFNLSCTMGFTYADRDAKRKLATSSGGGMLSSLTGGVLGGGGMTGIVGNLAGNYVGKFFG